MKRTVIAALALLWAASASFAATYYVSPTGKDTNNGLTPQTAFASINAADSKGLLVPGDRVEVMSGTYNLKEANVVFKVSGTEEAPVVYATEGAVLTNAGYAFGGRVDNITVDGFTIKDSATGIQIRGSNITVRNCVFENISGTCVYFMSGDGEKVENCRFFDFTGTSCVQIGGLSSNEYGNENIFGNNAFRAIEGTAVNITGTSTNKIYNNTFLDSGEYCVKVYTGGNYPANGDVKNNIFEGAESYALFCTESASSVTHSNNLYFNNRYDYGPGLTPAAGDVNGNPLIDPVTFAPLNGSAAINMGVDVGLPYNGDAPDIGAVESASQAKSGIVVARALRQGDNTPAAGVTIHAGDYYAVTGDDGICRIPTPAGECEVYADGNNVSRFKPIGTQTVTVGIEETVYVDVYGEYQNNIYYVDYLNGNDENNGTEAYPFRAPSCADEKNLLEPGDTVIVLNIGSSRLGQLKNCSGTPDNPIIYKGPGSIINLSAENVSNIEFDGISFIGLSAFGPALKINGDNIVVKNSEITGSDWGIDVGSGTGLVIENCKFMNSTKGGIRKDTDSSAILTKNIFYNVGEHAMLLKGTNTIRNCTIRNTGIGIEVLSGNTEAVNTVVSDCEKGFVCGDGAVLTNSYTMFYNCDTPATGCALGENTLYDNPKLVDFVPAPDSPAVDAGKDVGLPYNGIAIDLGAIESEQNEYVRVTDDISDIEEGTFVTLGEGHAVTSTEPIVLTREDRLGGIECSQHPDSYNFGEIALGDRVVFKGVVSNGRIGVFEVISKQPGEELKPFAAYNLLNEYMPQSVVGKLKRLGNGKQAVIDTGKELVTAMLPEDFSGNVYIDDIVSATGVVRRDCIYAQRMDDFAIIRTDVPRIDAKYDPRLPIRSAEYTLTGFVPVNDPNSIWGRVWKVNSVSGNPASIKIDCKGLTISEIMIRMKFDRIPNGHWSLISTNSASDQSPYSVGYENGETTYKWTFANVSDTTIILTPVEQEPTGTAYSATVSALYIK